LRRCGKAVREVGLKIRQRMPTRRAQMTPTSVGDSPTLGTAGDREIYRDNREARTFCPNRYWRSFELPNMIRTLEKRRCEFARGLAGLVNYVTMATTDGERSAAFLDHCRDFVSLNGG
jgi:hypothetical protein